MYVVVEIEPCCMHFATLYGPFLTKEEVANRCAAIEVNTEGYNSYEVYALVDGTFQARKLSEI